MQIGQLHKQIWQLLTLWMQLWLKTEDLWSLIWTIHLNYDLKYIFPRLDLREVSVTCRLGVLLSFCLPFQPGATHQAPGKQI